FIYGFYFGLISSTEEECTNSDSDVAIFDVYFFAVSVKSFTRRNQVIIKVDVKMSEINTNSWIKTNFRSASDGASLSITSNRNKAKNPKSQTSIWSHRIIRKIILSIY